MSIWQSAKINQKEKEQFFQQMVLAKLDNHMQIDKLESYLISYKN